MNWADQFNTYEDACRYYGVETPAQLAAMAAAEFYEECAEHLDAMEAAGGPVGRFVDPDEDIPF